MLLSADIQLFFRLRHVYCNLPDAPTLILALRLIFSWLKIHALSCTASLSHLISKKKKKKTFLLQRGLTIVKDNCTLTLKIKPTTLHALMALKLTSNL